MIKVYEFKKKFTYSTLKPSYNKNEGFLICHI